MLGTAPEITGTQQWFNTPGGRPLSLRSLRGEVVLIDFWTYSCINCIRTLPHLKAWDARYREAGLQVVGVHAPEFPFERDAGNVEHAIHRNGLRYPVVQDNDFATWNAYGNQFWPAKYLIDARGRVRYTHFGEGDYEETERRSARCWPRPARPPRRAVRGATADSARAAATPESYLGAERAERFVNGAIAAGTRPSRCRRRTARLPLPPPRLEGRWRIGGSHAVAAGTVRVCTCASRPRRCSSCSASHRPGRATVEVCVDGQRRGDRRVYAAIGCYEIVRLPRARRRTC